MPLTNPRRPFDPEQEYRAIEATLLESARGRWFLAEHGRRARRLDSVALQDAIGRLQSSLRDPPALLGQLRTEIEGLQGLLTETRQALVKKPVADPVAGVRPGADGILSAAQSIHEMAWDLQARDLDVEACERIAREAAQIYALSHRQALESQRVQTLTAALDAALGRLDGLLETVGHEMQLDAFAPMPEATGAPAEDMMAEDRAADAGALAMPGAATLADEPAAAAVDEAAVTAAATHEGATGDVAGDLPGLGWLNDRNG